MPKPKKAFLPPNKAVCLPVLSSEMWPTWLLGWTRELVCVLGLPRIRCAHWVSCDFLGLLFVSGNSGAPRPSSSADTKKQSHWVHKNPESKKCQHLCIGGIWLKTEKSQAMPASSEDRRTWVMAPPLTTHLGEAHHLQPCVHHPCADGKADGEWAEVKTG